MKVTIKILSITILFLFLFSFAATAKANAYTVSGKITDPNGIALTNQRILIGGIEHAAFTDINGNYSLDLPSVGEYPVTINYSLDASSGVQFGGLSKGTINAKISIQDNTLANIVLPLNKVVIHTRTPDGDSVPKVQITSNNVQNQNLIIDGLYEVSGTSSLLNATTGLNGNLETYLLSTSSSQRYSFNAIPIPPTIVNNTRLENMEVMTDNSTIWDITLTFRPVLKGKILDADGNGIPNLNLFLNPASNVCTPKTDTNGNYSCYLIPDNYQISIGSSKYGISGRKEVGINDEIYDIQLPFKKVRFHLQDPLGIPIPNVNISNNQLTTTFTIPGMTNVTANIPFVSSYGLTDENGQLEIFLLPSASQLYNFALTPQSVQQSGFQSAIVPQSITSDGDLFFTLAFTHSQPTTNVVLSPTPDSQGNYSRNVTVTLSASAASGHSINSIYYSIDGGLKQTYTAPFIISDEGEHILEYWSIDNSTVQETHKSKTFSITNIANQAPQINTIPAVNINLGSTYSANGSFNDADSTNWTATVDYGEGAGAEILVLDGTTFALNHDYQTPNTRTLTIQIHDNQGAVGTETSVITVNAPAQIASLSNATINEGDTYAVNGTFTDADSTSWIATVDYGDVSGVQNLPISGNDFSLNHVYKDNGNYTIAVIVTDNQGAVSTSTINITVINVNASIAPITTSINPVQVNTSITASATFTDSGVLDTHTAIWNWGDGNTSVGLLQEQNGSTPGSVTANHTYIAAGVYEITFTITDNNIGKSIKVYQYQTVYDQAAGWASGSKEFTSPQGAVVGNPNNSGKSNFGFQVKYQQGDLIPSGKNVEFNLPSANLEFTSTGYLWLAVNGTKATFKATGTLNGVSGYTVLVSAIDQGQGQQNGLIRFQIKDPSNNVVYDTQPGASDTTNPITLVTKGNIAVH